MKTPGVYRWTGLFGIGLYLLVLAEIPLYFIYTPTPAGTPPPEIITMRILIDMVVSVGLIGFFSGLKSIINRVNPLYDWMGTFIFSNGIAIAILGFIADSVQAGSVWVAGSNPVNPTWVGYGAEGSLLIYGPINRLLMATLLVAGGAAVTKMQIAPKWTGLLAYITALYNLGFVPTLFHVTTPLDFYSINGWNIPIAAGLFFLWVLVISIFFIRQPNTR